MIGLPPGAPHGKGDAPDVYAFITQLTRDREHGLEFQYCSAVTDTLGWIIEAVTGNRYADEPSDRLWSRIGAEHPARVSVNRAGNALANGGISATARDLARVGRLMLGGSVYGVGIHGQYLWLDPLSDTVIVRFSSLPRPVSLDDTRHNAALCADIVAALEG